MDYFKKINTLSLAEMIKSARKSLYLCLPSLHPEISQAIAELNFMQNMPEETVQIHILVDFDANTFRQGYGDYESMESLFMEGDDIKCLKDNRISFIICDNIGYYLFIESRTMIPADKETINAVRIDPISIVRLKSYFFPDIDKTDIKDELANAIIEESQTLSSPEKLIPETPAPISVISDEEIREVSFNLETNPPLNPDFKRKVEFYKNKIEMEEKRNIIIYNTADGKAKVALYAKDGMVWMNQNQLAELFDTSKQNISQHIINILNEGELQEN